MGFRLILNFTSGKVSELIVKGVNISLLISIISKAKNVV